MFTRAICQLVHHRRRVRWATVATHRLQCAAPTLLELAAPAQDHEANHTHHQHSGSADDHHRPGFAALDVVNEVGGLHARIHALHQGVDASGEFLAPGRQVRLDLLDGAAACLLAGVVGAHDLTPCFTASTSFLMFSPVVGEGAPFNFDLPMSARISVITSRTPATMSDAAQNGITVAKPNIPAVRSQPKANSPNTAAPANIPAPMPIALPLAANWAWASWISSRISAEKSSVTLPSNVPIEGRTLEWARGGVVPAGRDPTDGPGPPGRAPTGGVLPAPALEPGPGGGGAPGGVPPGVPGGAPGGGFRPRPAAPTGAGVPGGRPAGGVGPAPDAGPEPGVPPAGLGYSSSTIRISPSWCAGLPVCRYSQPRVPRPSNSGQSTSGKVGRGDHQLAGHSHCVWLTVVPATFPTRVGEAVWRGRLVEYPDGATAPEQVPLRSERVGSTPGRWLLGGRVGRRDTVVGASIRLEDLDHDAVPGAACVHQIQGRVRAGSRKETFTLTEYHRIHQQRDLVDQVVGEQPANHAEAAMDLQFAGVRSPQFPDGGQGIAGQDRRALPRGVRQSVRDDVLGVRIQGGTDGVVAGVRAPSARAPGTGEDLIGPAPEEKCVGAQIKPAEVRLNLLIEERHRPTAALEAIAPVLIAAAESLHHGVDGDVGDRGEFHRLVPFVVASLLGRHRRAAGGRAYHYDEYRTVDPTPIGIPALARSGLRGGTSRP